MADSQRIWLDIDCPVNGTATGVGHPFAVRREHGVSRDVDPNVAEWCVSGRDGVDLRRILAASRH